MSDDEHEAPVAAHAAGPRRPGGGRRWLPWAVATAVAVVAGAAFTGGFVASRYEARLGVMARQTSAAREELRREAARLREELQTYRRVLDVFRDPATRVITLVAADPAAQAVGRILWNETDGAHVLVANLQPAPPGKVYEVWAVARGTPRAAGLFEVDASGAAVARISPAPGAAVDGFTVTMEPAGGAPAPTGPVVLVSKAR